VAVVLRIWRHLSFSPRALLKRYNEGGVETLGDQRIHNGTKPTILTRPVSAWIHAYYVAARSGFLTMSVEAKIKVITCWSLSDRTNR
jgi:hypothetical protein